MALLVILATKFETNWLRMHYIELKKESGRLQRKNYFTILLVLTLCMPVYADEKVITVASSHLPPKFIAYSGGNNGQMEVVRPGQRSLRYSGYTWDVVAASYQYMGYTLKVASYPWRRAMSRVLNGHSDIVFPTVYSKERAVHYAYSAQPVNDVHYVIYRRSDDKRQKINSLGLMNGWYYSQKFYENPNITHVSVKSLSQAFSLLETYRLDAVGGYQFLFDYYLSLRGFSHFFTASQAIGIGQEYVTAAKANPKAEQLLADFDLGLKGITANGTLAKIQQRWRYHVHGDMAPPEFDGLGLKLGD